MHELNSMFDDEGPSRISVYPWNGQFNNGRTSLQNEVVQNQLLLRKPSMVFANWYCKIIMWPIIRFRQPEASVGPINNIHNFDCRKNSLVLDPKNPLDEGITRWRCFKTSGRWWIAIFHIFISKWNYQVFVQPH